MSTAFDVPGTVRLRDVNRPLAGETPAQAIQRLAEKAVINGIRLVMEHATEAIFATSATMPDVVYAVGPGGCTCQGYRSFQRCQHFALWAVTMGEPDNDPDGAAVAEVARLEALHARGRLKTTADFKALSAARAALAA